MDFTEELMFNIDGTGYIRKYEEGVWSPKQNIRWKIKSAKYLNVDKEYKYVESESTFDSKKAPIYINTKQKINHYNIKKPLLSYHKFNERKISQEIDQINSIKTKNKSFLNPTNWEIG